MTDANNVVQFGSPEKTVTVTINALGREFQISGVLAKIELSCGEKVAPIDMIAAALLGRRDFSIRGGNGQSIIVPHGVLRQSVIIIREDGKP